MDHITPKNRVKEMSNLSSFEAGFCGGEPFWDAASAWATSDPELTGCFHKTVLAWTPPAVLLLLLPVEVAKCRRSLHRYLITFFLGTNVGQ